MSKVLKFISLHSYITEHVYFSELHSLTPAFLKPSDLLFRVTAGAKMANCSRRPKFAVLLHYISAQLYGAKDSTLHLPIHMGRTNFQLAGGFKDPQDDMCEMFSRFPKL